jgi:hypothetical protein
METCRIDKQQGSLCYSFSNLPEVKNIGRNVIEYWLLLLLYRLFEMANILRVCNLDGKNTIRLIAIDPTVEAELLVS